MDIANEVSRARLVILRLVYAFVALGQALFFWPSLLHHSSEWALRYGDLTAILGAMAILMALGIKYPLRMLPILIFEFTWKAVWILAVYVPLAQDGRVDAATRESLFNVGLGVVLCGLAIPWGYVARRYLLDPAERWRKPAEIHR